MKAIHDFQTIQVELTNACIHSCSNCTRFCGHHKNNFFMDWDTFKKAIDSLENWNRRIGIMGGEPTLHPDFQRYVEYAYDKLDIKNDLGGGHTPIQSLSKYIEDANSIKDTSWNDSKGLGLWSSVCNKYYKHYELIQDKFYYQCINDHTVSSRHQAWLLTRKEFGIGDEEWIKLRDNCWWQRLLGSPSITPKGAFFCEVAAAMDMLFNGPGGWKIEKDWWKRGPEDYKDQLKWCEFCSGAFLKLDRDANEEVDDVSPIMLQKLKEVESPKVNKKGALYIHEVSENGIAEINPRSNMLLYQPSQELRFTDKNTNLFPRRIVGITIIRNLSEFNEEILKNNSRMFDEFLILTNEEHIKQKIEANFKVCLCDNFMNKIANILFNEKDWISVCDCNVKLEKNLREKINKTIFNPGSYHIFKNSNMKLFNVMASCLKKSGFNEISSLIDIEELNLLWTEDKIIFLDDNFYKIEQPDFDEWEKNIKNTYNHNRSYYETKFISSVINRNIVPQIKAIVSEKNNISEIMINLDNIEIGKANSVEVCNKIKTAIHNQIGKYHCVYNGDFEKIRENLIKASDSYCANYALSMISTPKERIEYLKKCVDNKKNVINLGESTLKNYEEIDSYNVIESGILEEILNISSYKHVVVIGNRYRGKSIEMILTNANRKPVCYADDDRHDYAYNGIESYSFQDAIERYPDAIYVNSLENQFERFIKKEKVDIKVINLSSITISEMDRLI